MADLRDQEDVDTGRAMRAMPSAKPLKAGPSDEDVSMAMDAGYMGGGKKFNTETGELYDTTASPSKPAATVRKKTVPAAKKPYSMTSDTIDENVKQRSVMRSAPPAASPSAAIATDTGDETSRLAKRYPKKPPREFKQSDVPFDTFTMKKKGGSIKKMASGGMAKAEKPAAKGWGKARSARAAKYY
jgi:hypothetical protein